VAAVAEPFDDQPTERPAADATPLPPVPPHLARDIALYVLARFVLVAVVAFVLSLVNVPPLIAIAVGFVVGLPLSMVLLRGWHERITTGLAARGMARRAARDQLRAELRGEVRSPEPGPS
jgi:uncharacterized protein DUF4229